jgi:uncharacterized protein (TIGR03118 family)
MNKCKYAQMVGLGLSVILTCVLALVIPRVGQAQGGAQEAQGAASHVDGYEQHNLVSDLADRADRVDPNLVNPWGLTSSPTGPWWVANNGTGTATLYRGDGAPVPNPTSPFVVKIPSANGTDNGVPTGIVFNTSGGFAVSEDEKAGRSVFIFASEDGVISGWSPHVNPTAAIVGIKAPDAVYKGLAIGQTRFGTFIYATNFLNGTIDVFDAEFHQAHLHNIRFPHSFAPEAFIDRQIPPGFAPFGIQNIGGLLFVTYAKQEPPDNTDDEPGPGNGFVNIFTTRGQLISRFAARGALNSPWGLALAPHNFGQFSNHLLVGNFGDGHINAFNLRTGELDGQLSDPQGQPITIDGLWSLKFGNGFDSGPTNLLFFTAGIEDEAHGLFGTLRAVSNKERDCKP